MWIFLPFNSDFMRTQVNAMGTGQRQSLKAFSKMIMTIKNDADSGMRMMMTMPTMIVGPIGCRPYSCFFLLLLLLLLLILLLFFLFPH